jgi:arylsulfatase A
MKEHPTLAMQFARWSAATLCGLSSVMFAAGAPQSDPAQRPPNIVLIVADDMGWNQVGYHGFNWYETPNIDRIARAGLQFRHAYSAAPICSPTRAALMTGKYPARLRLTDYIPGNPHADRPLVTPQQVPCLPLEETTIPEMLRPLGYASGHFGKWHLGVDYKYKPGRLFDPASQGFDVVYTAAKPESDLDPAPPDAHSAVAITEHAVRFIEEYRDRPFFCYVPHNVVHRPLYEEEALIEKYRRKPGSDQAARNPIMGAMIERMDTGIGRILDTLERLELVDNTVVIFVSDNGGLEALQSQAPLRAGKSTLYEGGIRVPMAVRWPGVVRAGGSTDVPVVTHDLFSTIMEIAGVPYRRDYADGVSIVPLLRGSATTLGRDAIYWHYPHYHHFGGRPGTAIRAGDYKLIEWYEGTLVGLGPAVELFNVVDDIGETRDLATAQPERVAAMREKLHEWRRSMNAQEMTVRAATTEVVH